MARLKVKVSLLESQKANQDGPSEWSDQDFLPILLENPFQSRREELKNVGSVAVALILPRVPCENDGPSWNLKDSSFYLQVGHYPSLHGS